MKKILLTIVFLSILIGCTKKFEDYNTNPYGASEKEFDKVPTGASELESLQALVIPQQENSYQMCFDLIATPYAGYASQPKFRKDYPTYTPRDGWMQYPYNNTYPKIYSPYFELRKLAKGDIERPFFAWGTILKVAITHWLTDTYGGIPYSKMEVGKLQQEYDSQEVLYMKMCDDLKMSIESLKKQPDAGKPYASNDKVYGGDISKWIKYANSLLLRISLRMSDVAPAKAQEYAQYALSNGVIENNSENAKFSTLDNPVYKISVTWGDSRVGADITEYMNAYSDPRREKYFTSINSRKTENNYFGLSSTNKNVSINADDYSLPNVQQNTPIVWISAAEVAFIKAEMALKGWNVGGTAKELYKRGIELSFEQWGISNVENYLNNTATRGNFNDEKAPGFNASFHSDITVKWEDQLNSSDKLAKIITQKWIAMYPYGSQEAWAEWRRTGYPNMLPVVTNDSGGVIKSVKKGKNNKDQGGMRRIPYPQQEYTTNGANVKNAVRSFLGGLDNGSVDMWWVKK